MTEYWERDQNDRAGGEAYDMSALEHHTLESSPYLVVLVFLQNSEFRTSICLWKSR